MANPYTRQSSFSDGDTINSALFNDEYDLLVLAFSTSGHTHDGSTGEGAPITKLGPTQDIIVASNSILPKTNNVVDLGSSSKKFKDAYFSGNVNVDGVVTHSGNMTIGNAATDTLTINATIQGSSLVFEGASANAHEMTLAIPDVSADKTITFPNATDTLVGKATTDTLTNKTLTAPVISSITNSGTITLPTSTDTLVGRATTDTLTNKTLTSAVLTTPVLNTSVSGTAFLDEDNMVSNSATKIASQQSIKAYVDGQTTDLTAEGSTNLYYTNARADARIAANLIDEDNMSSNSATRLPSQQSVKAYVDAEIAAVPVGDVTSVVAGTGLTGGGTTGDVTVNVIGGTGITANANDIAIDSSVTTLTGTQTLSAKTLTSPVLNTGVSGTAVKDEDNMSSNSATHLATQQSIKAYVDAEITGGSTTNEAIQDVAGGMVTGNTETGITVTYQDADGTIDFVVASQTDQNFTNADHTKLDGIENSATADQSNAEIRAAVEAASNSHVFNDDDHTKLNAIEAQADVTDSTNVVAALTAGTGITISSGGTIAAGALALTTVQTANSQSAQLGLTTQEGDVVIRSDENKTYIHNSGSAGNMNDFTLIATPTDAVASVAGNTGVVTNAHIAAAVEAASNSHTFNDADHSKLNAIAASANNYVHPNHSGEVTSTADGATVIADNVVDEANLKVSNSPVNGYVLTAQSGNTGGMTWATTAEALPSQSGNSGEFLTTNGSAASWAAISTGNTTTNGLWEHSNTIASNYSVTSGNNALTAGPITINSNVSVTIPSGSTWVIA